MEWEVEKYLVDRGEEENGNKGLDNEVKEGIELLFM